VPFKIKNETTLVSSIYVVSQSLPMSATSMEVNSPSPPIKSWNIEQCKWGSVKCDHMRWYIYDVRSYSKEIRGG
jgi:hypothetical protein